MCDNSRTSYYYDKFMSTKFTPSMNLEKDPQLQFIIDNIDSVTGIGNLSRDMDIARHIRVAVVSQKKKTTKNFKNGQKFTHF